MVFSVGERLFALPLELVGRIVRATDVTPLADAPPCVEGLIDVEGEFMPVIEVGRCLGLPGREIELSDRFLIARSAGRAAALRVERVDGVMAWAPEDFMPVSGLMPGAPFLRGIARGPQGMVLVQDLDAFLGMYDGPRGHG
ncbi:MAG: purine-binding chemotaxis protein CheW [Zoogloea sp.]|nr:purine-binding chemotaxis protein CheW [Zoogloea sp.]